MIISKVILISLLGPNCELAQLFSFTWFMYSLSTFIINITTVVIRLLLLISWDQEHLVAYMSVNKDSLGGDVLSRASLPGLNHDPDISHLATAVRKNF